MYINHLFDSFYCPKLVKAIVNVADVFARLLSNWLILNYLFLCVPQKVYFRRYSVVRMTSAIGLKSVPQDMRELTYGDARDMSILSGTHNS